jgi:hypothetical protein
LPRTPGYRGDCAPSRKQDATQPPRLDRSQSAAPVAWTEEADSRRPIPNAMCFIRTTGEIARRYWLYGDGGCDQCETACVPPCFVTVCYRIVTAPPGSGCVARVLQSPGDARDHTTRAS